MKNLTKILLITLICVAFSITTLNVYAEGENSTTNDDVKKLVDSVEDTNGVNEEAVVDNLIDKFAQTNELQKDDAAIFISALAVYNELRGGTNEVTEQGSLVMKNNKAEYVIKKDGTFLIDGVDYVKVLAQKYSVPEEDLKQLYATVVYPDILNNLKNNNEPIPEDGTLSFTIDQDEEIEITKDGKMLYNGEELASTEVKEILSDKDIDEEDLQNIKTDGDTELSTGKVEATTQPTNNTTNKALPKTGESNNTIFQVIGISIITIGILGFIIYKRRRASV